MKIVDRIKFFKIPKKFQRPVFRFFKNLEVFQFRWLKFKEIYAAFPFSIALLSYHLYRAEFDFRRSFISDN